MKIVVLAGGMSAERNVSLSTGVMVCQALRERGHQVAFVDMFLGLEGYEREEADLFFAPIPTQFKKVSREAPDLEAVRASRKDRSPNLFGPGVVDLCRQADMVFLALHGAYGEDGRVQAAFDLLGIPYTGPGYLGSAVAMDKNLTKRIVKDVGVRTPSWQTLRCGPEDVEKLSQSLSVPCVIKVPRSGSALGVFIVKDRADCKPALRSCLEEGSEIIVEQYIQGRELTCAVLDDEALPTVEIIPQVAFYDYESKYQPGATLEICPGRIPAETEEAIREMALKAHQTLGLTVCSRSDFILGEDGLPYFLEINTLPGMTPTSLVPQEAAAVGISYGELCEKILTASIKARGI